jgi:hypothetical protein
MNGAPLMNSRRITLTLGAAGGGLLAAAFLQTAVAFADTTALVSPVGPSPTEVFNFEPTGSETDVSTTDLPLGLGDISTGTQEFDVIDTGLTGDPTVGTIDASVTDTDILGVTTVGEVVTSDLTGTTGDPTVGSVYDTLTFDDSGYSIVLTDIPSTTAGQTLWISTLALDTPFGDYTLPTPVLVVDVLPPVFLDIALDTPFGDYTLPLPVVVDVLPSPVDIVGAASGDGLTAGGGVTADTVGTAAIDGLTGLLGLF